MTEFSVAKEKQNGVHDFDDLLPYAGEFGLYQIFLFTVTLPFYFYFAFVYYGQIFLTEVPQQHWCYVPELANLTTVERRSLSIPPDDNRFGHSRCLMYDLNWADVLNKMAAAPGQGTPTVKCQNGWEYNMTDIPYVTAGAEMEWVCDSDNLQASAQSLFFVGSIVGSLVFGHIADRYGRIPVTVLSNLVGCLGGVLSAFSQTFWQFALTRIVVGMAYDNCVMMIYILVLEYTAPRYRTAMANLSFAVFYTLSSCCLPWLALAVGDWRNLALVLSAPLGLALFTPFAVPESPRWLLSKGRVDDAIIKLKRIAKINSKVIPDKVIDEFKASFSNDSNEPEAISMLDLFKSTILRKQFILICVAFMLASVIFDCLVRIMGSLGTDFFISFTVASATEFPSLILLVIVMDWLGRRWMTASCFTIVCVFSLLSAFVPAGAARLASASTARFAANMAYNGVIQWTPELLPSGARGAGAAAVHLCGYLGAVLAPHIVYLESVRWYLPQVSLCVLAAGGAAAALLLAETSGRALPQTCADAELMAREQSFWELPGRRKTKKEGIENVACAEL